MKNRDKTTLYNHYLILYVQCSTLTVREKLAIFKNKYKKTIYLFENKKNMGH